MSYTPTTWAAGDTVTAAKLNKLEQGVASSGGVLVVHDVDGTLDKTWQEISDAGFAILSVEGDVGITSTIKHSTHDGYYVNFAMLLPNGSGFDDPLGYVADTASGYPVAH